MGAQEPSEVPVDFHRGFVSGKRNDFPRERSLSRADFHDGFSGVRVDAANDAVDPVAIMQKILPEAFAGVMSFQPFLFHGVGTLCVGEK